MKKYYLSFHPGAGCVITKCFLTARDRAEFKKMVNTKTAKIQEWEA